MKINKESIGPPIPGDAFPVEPNLTVYNHATKAELLRRAIAVHGQWIEQTLQTTLAETVILEVSVDLLQVAVEQVLGYSSPQNLVSTALRRLRPLIGGIEIPSSISPILRILKGESDNSLRALIFGSPRKNPGLEWQDCPVSFRFRSITVPVVAMNVFYHSGPNADAESRVTILVASRGSAEQVIDLIQNVSRKEARPQLHTLHDETRPVQRCDWNQLVLDSRVVFLLRNDFESFWERERWFSGRGLPFRRGYLDASEFSAIRKHSSFFRPERIAEVPARAFISFSR